MAVYVPSYPALRRQDSTQPSIATPTVTEHVSHEPKIGGSQTAFFVVVILLAIIVIAASAGIYFLLRNGEPLPADRAARRKYSIRRPGVRSHPLPIGLPGSFSEKIGSVFKGRRAGTGAGWMPARDFDDDDDLYVGGEWDSTDEPLRVREHELDPHGHGSPAYQQHDGNEYPRVGITPASRRTTLTEPATEGNTHKSRSASHVDAGHESSSPDGFGRVDPPVPLTRKPHDEWLDARDPRSGDDNGSGIATPLRYLTPEPRRADSGHEIPLFAGSTPFQD